MVAEDEQSIQHAFAESGEVILRYARARGGGLTIKVPPKTDATRPELLKAIEGLLAQG